MNQIRRSTERGHLDHGWLDTYHTVSFASYDDPNHIGFSELRVINPDRVQAGQGFGTHGHRDMEILSYVLEGVLEHRDSMGNGSRILPGQVQFMSAGSGITHSEFNGSAEEDVHFLQMWVLPAENGTPPRYGEMTVFESADDGGFHLAASPDGRDGSIRIGADVSMHVGRLATGEVATHELAQGRRAWLHLATGALRVNGVDLEAGDGVAVADEARLEMQSSGSAEFVLFDLP